MQNPPRIWLNYRPVRVGWVVADKDIVVLTTAAAWSSCLWGGRFNPIIPMHDISLSERLIDVFAVDVLIPLVSSDATRAFVARFPHLSMHRWHEGIFNQRKCDFADIRHVLRRIASDQDDQTESNIVLPIWQEADDLSTYFSIVLGVYPASSEHIPDYKEGIRHDFQMPDVPIAPDGEMPAALLDKIPPLLLTGYNMTRRRDPRGWLNPAVVLGSISDFDDLVLFWNLRAAGASACFYDQSQGSRLQNFANAFLQRFRGEAFGETPRINFWIRAERTPEQEWRPDLALNGLQLGLCDGRGDGIWNGMNIEPQLPQFSAWHRDVVPSYLEADGKANASFGLPDRPFRDDDVSSLNQNFVVVVDAAQYGLSPDSELTFETPFVPSMNEFYGRNFYHDRDAARAQLSQMDRWSVAIITDVSTQRLHINAFRVLDWMKEFFSQCGMTIHRSEAGLRGSRLIAQMGGVQDCRVFKIRGVRNLLRKYGIEDSFTRSGAIEAIRDVVPQTGEVGFDAFKNLYIEYRESGDLSPDAVLKYLLARRVFRVGLELKCPNCELPSWMHLDDIRTTSTCPYCDHGYDVTQQLKDRDWRYRRSGIFGRDDNQLGGVPVALTLQQISSALNERVSMYSTGISFTPTQADIEPCESDFVVIVEGLGSSAAPVQILFGEAKTSGRIDEQDVRKLGKLMNAIPEKIAQPFVLFSKTSAFSSEEVALVRGLNGRYRKRVILWSQDELEPFHPYERAAERLGSRQHAVTLSDMAEATDTLWLT